jgi:glycosyltransferase involved in cell wall biosynthesis
MIDDALAASCHHEVVARAPRLRGPFRLFEVPELVYHWYRFAKRRDAVLVRGHMTALFGCTSPSVTIIHHIDPTKSRPLVRLVESLIAWRFFSRRDMEEPIVTIAECWRDSLSARGYKNVNLIYCGFRLQDYEVSDQELADFRERYDLQDAPILYIGNPQWKKGADLSYSALKDSGYTLVTSGVGDLTLPARHLDLRFRDYVCLLKSAVAVVTMSRFQEGWNRVAHEAMLVGTPVIGSGTGGMMELLRGGNQLVCLDPTTLTDYVKRAVRDRERLGADGRDFAQTFSVERFDRAWLELIAKLANVKSS